MKRLNKPLWSLGFLLLSIVYLLLLLVLWSPMFVAGLVRKKAYTAYFNTRNDSFVDWIRLIGTDLPSFTTDDTTDTTDSDLYVMVEWSEAQPFIGRPDCYEIHNYRGKSFGTSAGYNKSVYFVPKELYHKLID